MTHYQGSNTAGLIMRTFAKCSAIILCLVTVSVSGRESWNANGNYEYFVSAKGEFRDTYKEAKNSCQTLDGRVASVKTRAIQDFIESLIVDESFGGRPYAFFIGLRKVGGKYIWDDGEDTVFVDWRENEPTPGDGEKCVVMGTGLTYSAVMKWNNIQCESHNLPVGQVCQRLIGLNWGSWRAWGECNCAGVMKRNRTCIDSGRPGPKSCVEVNSIQNTTCVAPPECNVATLATTTAEPRLGRGKWETYGAYQYYVSDQYVGYAYDGAQTFCNENDGELAIVKSQDIQTFIASIVTADKEKNSPYGFYIGLRYNEATNTSVWTDGSALGTFAPWSAGEPNNRDGEERCVAMGDKYTSTTELKWHDYRCVIGTYGKKGFVCQRKIGHFWDEWSSFSGCGCSVANETRNRTCKYSGRPGPNECNGSSVETRACLYEPACFTTPVGAPTTMDQTTALVPITTAAQETMAVTSAILNTSTVEQSTLASPLLLVTTLPVPTLVDETINSDSAATAMPTTIITTTTYEKETTAASIRSTSTALETSQVVTMEQSTFSDSLPSTANPASTFDSEVITPGVAITEVATSHSAAVEMTNPGGVKAEVTTPDAMPTETITRAPATTEVATQDTVTIEAITQAPTTIEVATPVAVTIEVATMDTVTTELITPGPVTTETITLYAASTEMATMDAASAESITPGAETAEVATLGRAIAEETTTEATMALSLSTPIMTTYVSETMTTPSVQKASVAETSSAMAMMQSTLANSLPATELIASTLPGETKASDALTTVNPAAAMATLAYASEATRATSLSNSVLLETTLPIVTTEQSMLGNPSPATEFSASTSVVKTTTIVPAIAPAPTFAATSPAVTKQSQSTIATPFSVTSASRSLSLGQTITDMTTEAAANTAPFGDTATTKRTASENGDAVTNTSSWMSRTGTITNSNGVSDSGGRNQDTTLKEATETAQQRSTGLFQPTTAGEVTVIDTTDAEGESSEQPSLDESTKTSPAITKDAEPTVTASLARATTRALTAVPAARKRSIVPAVAGASGGLLLLAVIIVAAYVFFRHRRSTGEVDLIRSSFEMGRRESDRQSLGSHNITMAGFSEHGFDGGSGAINPMFSFKSEDKCGGDKIERHPVESNPHRQEEIPSLSELSRSVANESKSSEIAESDESANGGEDVKDSSRVVVNGDRYSTVVKKKSTDNAAEDSSQIVVDGDTYATVKKKSTDDAAEHLSHVVVDGDPYATVVKNKGTDKAVEESSHVVVNGDTYATVVKNKGTDKAAEESSHVVVDGDTYATIVKKKNTDISNHPA